MALLFVLLVSAGCLGTADETPPQEEKTPPYGENTTISDITEGHDEDDVQGYRYMLSIRDAETGELRRELIARIDYADEGILTDENVTGEDVSRTTYVNLSSGIRYVDRELGDSIYPEPEPEEVNPDEVVERYSLPATVGSLPANQTRLTLKETDEEGVFTYSVDSVTVEDTEVTNASVSLTAEGFIRGFSFTAEGLEYTAEVEKRGDIDLETPDWVDTEEAPSSFNFGISVDQTPGEVEFVFVHVGNLVEARLEGPGGASADIDGILAPGVVVKISDAGFSEDEIEGELVTPNEHECVIRHGEDEITGQPVDSADIPCDGSGIDGLEGDDIRYETGAEYRIVGVVDGEEAVIKSVTTGQE